MFNSKNIASIVNNNDPVHNAVSKEFIEGMLKVGSFLSIICGKKINSSTLFTMILENSDIRYIFVSLTGSVDERSALLSILHLYPALLKSKNVKKTFQKSLKNDRS
jgi:hypothetical protein